MSGSHSNMLANKCSHSSAILKAWFPKLALLVVFLFLAWLTWGRWGNLRVDSKELYVPQQIAHGKMLYRDLWYPYGPLVPYWMGLLLALFGERLEVFYVWGLIVTAGFASVLFSLARRFVPPFVGFVVTFVFLLQAFQPHLFNYILPYSYAATMASLLALVFLYFLVRHIRSEAGSNMAWAGLVAGLALLTKIEYGVACYSTFFFFIILQIRRNNNFRPLASELRSFLPGLLVPAAGYGWFLARLTPGFFLKDVYSEAFVARWLQTQGLRFVPGEVVHLLAMSMLSMLFWVAVIIVLKLIFMDKWRLLSLKTGLLTVLGVALYWGGYLESFRYFPKKYFLQFHFAFYPRGMFWLVLLFFLGVILQDRFHKSGSTGPALMTLCFYSLAVGVRIMSQVEAARYSIYYNSALFLVYCFVIFTAIKWLTRTLPTRTCTLVVAVLFTILATGLSAILFPFTFPPCELLRTPHGSIYLPLEEARVFSQAIEFIRHKKQEGKRVLVLPEDTSLYFFTQTEAPSRWYVLHPGLVNPEWKEREFIRQVQSQNVDFILLSNRDFKEYGFPVFGVDFNQSVYRWMQEDFIPVGELGQFQHTYPWKMGMLILERKSPKEISLQHSQGSFK
jgi:hypothetical protein